MRMRKNRIGKKYETWRASAWSEMSALKAVAEAMYIRESAVTMLPTRRRALTGSLSVGWTYAAH